MVKVQRSVAAIARLTERVRAVHMGGDRAICAAEVGCDHLFRRSECCRNKAQRGEGSFSIIQAKTHQIQLSTGRYKDGCNLKCCRFYNWHTSQMSTCSYCSST